jgi:hypothetical protein
LRWQVQQEGEFMAKINASYGSEFHLLRMLGRHRRFFDTRVCEATGADSVEWLDFPSGDMRKDKNGKPVWDKEWLRLDFLQIDDPARMAWQNAWPAVRLGGHNWDAVGRLKYGNSREWLLIEAKANIAELSSSCQAENPKSLDLIKQTLDRVKLSLNVDQSCDWLNGYYQFCNRLAVLNTMNTAGTAARMAFVYFYGDVGDSTRMCPSSERGWKPALMAQDQHVGLSMGHFLEDRIHKIFVDVRCGDLNQRFCSRLETFLHRHASSRRKKLMVEFYESLEQLGIEVPQPNYDSPWAFSISVIENSWELRDLVSKMMDPPEAAANFNQLLSMLEAVIPSDGHLE